MKSDGFMVAPRPIMYKSSVSPGYAGRVTVGSVALLPTKIAVPANAAVTKKVLPSALGEAYTAGCAALAAIVNGALLTPFTCVITWTFPTVTLAGTSALICVSLTYSSAAGDPLNVTVVPPNVTGNC